MSAPQGVESRPVGIPNGGANLRDALFSLAPSDSPWLLNIEPEPQYLRVRNGWHVHSIVTGTGTVTIGALGAYNDSELFAYIKDTSENNSVVDVTTSTPSSAANTGTDTPDEAYPFKFGRRFWFNTETAFSDGVRYYDGSSWASYGFTYSAATIGGRVTAHYKGRFYCFNGQYMYYGELEAITGATTRVDLTTLFSDASEIAWAAILSSPSNQADELLFAFGNVSGETLVYAGDYPDAANWEQVYRFNHSPVAYYNSVLEINNDVWIATKTGILSLRLLAQAQANEQEYYSVSSKIDPYITDLIKNTGTGTDGNRTSMVHWPEQNKVYVLMQGFLDKDGTYTSDDATMLVYNTISKAWCIQHIVLGFSVQLGSITYMNNALYFYVDNVVMKLNESSYKDEAFDDEDTFSEYNVEIEGVYSNYNNTRKQKTIAGFDALVKTDFGDGHIGMKAASDFGRKVSSLSYQKFPIDGYNNPYYPLNISGEFIQWRFSGTSDEASSDGFELYSVAVGLL